MGHFRFESLQNDWSAPAEARAKVKKPTPKTDDSHVTDYRMPNGSPTPPHFLNGGDYNEEAGQLKVRNAAAFVKHCVGIMAAPVGERQALIESAITTLANFGTLDAGSGEAGDRPHYDHHGTSKVFDAAYDEEGMDDMEPGEHLDQAHADLTEARGCDEEDDEGRYGHVMHACAHLSRYLSKTGGYEGDGDDDSVLGERGEKVLKTFGETNTADLEAAAVSIAKHTVQPGASHFGGFPKRK
jgi:hypothetical protein